MTKKKKNVIRLIDVTNRDGVQTSRLGLAKLQKTIVNVLLNDMGVYQSEFGFPVTRHETNYINANVELAKVGLIKPMVLEGWIRAIPQDVEEATKLTNVQHLNISISTSKQMIEGKFGGKKNKNDIIKLMIAALRKAKEKGIKTVGVNAEDASRTDIDYLIKFAKAARDNGADRIRYCDTLGFDNPMSIYAGISDLASEVGLPVEIHCHNDLGMVIANSVIGAKAAIDNGVDAYINTTINGLGERAGNADLVSVILALKYSKHLRNENLLDKKIKLGMAWKISKYASYAFGVPIPINQPGVGSNAFAHESGIHADGALKDRRNYELYDFEALGRGEPESVDTGRKITAGEYSGIKGFRNVYQRLAVKFKSDTEAREVLELVRYANVQTQKPLVEDELKFISSYPKIAKKILTTTP